MGKFILQFSLFAGVFFLMWWGLSKVPWVDRYHIQELTKEKQEQLSELVLKMHRLEKREVKNKQILEKVKRIKDIICEANYIDTSAIKIHVFEDKMINAFALPGGHIVVNTELINYSDNADMLAGVIAHEIGHIELDHVSRKLTREIGVSALLLITGGSEHMGVLKEILHTLSSRGFDRELEREADERAVMYMRQTNGDPRQLAYFLKKLSSINSDLPEVLKWISTHPEASERVENILTTTGNVTDPVPILEQKEWDKLKKLVKELDDN